jgi:hypothetical protein
MSAIISIVIFVIIVVIVKVAINRVNRQHAKLAAAYAREIEVMGRHRVENAANARKNQASNDVIARQQLADAVRADRIARALAEQAEVERIARQWDGRVRIVLVLDWTCVDTSI